MRKIIKIDFVNYWFEDTLEAKKNNSLYIFLKYMLNPYYNIEISDSPDFLFYSIFGNNHLKPRYNHCVKIFWTQENQRADFSECDYAFTFDPQQTDRHFRLPFYRTDITMYPRLKVSRDQTAIAQQKTKFCCFIVSNQDAAFRIKFYHELSKYKRVDSAGSALNNLGYNVPPGWEAKVEFMRPYKFCIAFENAEQAGYTTEKITHAFVAGTIPIYWGNPIVGSDFNAKSFINYFNHGSIEATIREVIRLDQDPLLYAKYLGESPLIGGQDLPALTDEAIANRFRKIFESGTIRRNQYARMKSIVRYKGLQLRKQVAWWLVKIPNVTRFRKKMIR